MATNWRSDKRTVPKQVVVSSRNFIVTLPIRGKGPVPVLDQAGPLLYVSLDDSSDPSPEWSEWHWKSISIDNYSVGRPANCALEPPNK